MYTAKTVRDHSFKSMELQPKMVDINERIEEAASKGLFFIDYDIESLSEDEITLLKNLGFTITYGDRYLNNLGSICWKQ